MKSKLNDTKASQRQKKSVNFLSLAIIDCIMQLGDEGRAKFNELFVENEDGSITVTLSSPKGLGQKVSSDEYQYERNEEEEKDIFTIPKSKVDAFKGDPNGANCESVNMQIIEHLFSSHYSVWQEGLRSCLDPRSKAEQRNLEEFVLINLLGFPYFGTVDLDQLVKLNTVIPTFPVYIGLEYGKKDRYGEFQQGQAFRLEEIIIDGNGNKEFVLVNPRDNQMRLTFSYEYMLKHVIRISPITKTKEEAKLLVDITEEGRYKPAYRLILKEAYKNTEFHTAIDNKDNDSYLKDLIKIHNAILKYRREINKYRSMVENFYDDADSLLRYLQANIENYTGGPYTQPTDAINALDSCIRGFKDKLHQEYMHLYDENRNLEHQLNPHVKIINENRDPSQFTASILSYHMALEKERAIIYKRMKEIQYLFLKDESANFNNLLNNVRKANQCSSIHQYRAELELLYEKRKKEYDAEPLVTEEEKKRIKEAEEKNQGIEQGKKLLGEIVASASISNVSDDPKLKEFKEKFESKLNTNQDITVIKETIDELERLKGSFQKSTSFSSFIEEYQKPIQHNSLFSRSKIDKASRVINAYNEVPVHLRGKIFEEITNLQLEPNERVAILRVRKEVFAHRNFIMRMLYTKQDLEHYSNLQQFEKNGAATSYNKFLKK